MKRSISASLVSDKPALAGATTGIARADEGRVSDVKIRAIKNAFLFINKRGTTQGRRLWIRTSRQNLKGLRFLNAKFVQVHFARVAQQQRHDVESVASAGANPAASTSLRSSSFGSVNQFGLQALK